MAKPTPSTPLVSLDAIVLDTETTGLDARAARLVQIGALRIVSGAVCPDKSFETLVRPGIPIPAVSTAIHGIDDTQVASAPTFAEVWPQLEAYLGRDILIGHTLTYDFAVIERELADAKVTWRRPPLLDIRMLSQIAMPTLADHTLDHICQALEIEVQGRHTAMGDAEATAAAFIALVPKLRKRNIRTLGEAYAAIRALSERELRASNSLMAQPATALETETDDTAGPVSRLDANAYRNRVRDVMSAPAHWANASDTVAKALKQMMSEQVSSLLIANDDGRVGIVTERDMLRSIAANEAAALDGAVGAIQTAPLLTVWQDAFLYRAIGRMQRLGTRHLGVVDETGAIVGAVTARNLLAGRAAAATMLGDEIQTATSAAELAAAWGRLPAVALKLLADGVDARTITAVISDEIRLMTRRAADLAEASMRADGRGGPPVRYALLLLGSAGRGESMLAADQDNALVYETGAPGGPEDAWFAAFADRLNETLDAAGIPLCKGGIMARNPEWRRSLDDWRTVIGGWLTRTSPQDLLNVDIFFDAMPVHGDAALGLELWRHAYEAAGHAPAFLAALTEHARVPPNAFTLFGGFRHDDQGRLDLKMKGLFPIVAVARVMSIRHGVQERTTAKRYAGLIPREVGSPNDIDALIEAHETLLGAVLSQQLADIADGIPPSTRVTVGQLAGREKAALKRAIGAVDTAIGLVSEGRL